MGDSELTKVALITGINGQDGFFLSKILINEGYRVIGIGTKTHPSLYLDKRIYYEICDIRDIDKVVNLCMKYEVFEFYNLAGISSVAESFRNPEVTKAVNFDAPSKILLSLYSIPKLAQKIKFFQASSSEMFGITAIEPQNEETPLAPVSPYGHWKAEMHQVCCDYAKKGFFVSSAIMYNHESFLRPSTFITRKVSRTVSEISLNLKTKLVLGNLNAERDWGFAGDFAQAIRLIMRQDFPEFFVLATGKTHSVLELVKIAFREVDMEGRELDFLEVNSDLFRPQEINRLVGSYARIKQKLGWMPTVEFEAIVRSMVQFDLADLIGTPPNVN